MNTNGDLHNAGSAATPVPAAREHDVQGFGAQVPTVPPDMRMGIRTAARLEFPAGVLPSLAPATPEPILAQGAR